MIKTPSAVGLIPRDDTSQVAIESAEACTEYDRPLTTDAIDDEDDFMDKQPSPPIQRSMASRMTRSFVKLPWYAVKIYALLWAQSLRWWLAAWQVIQICICIIKLLAVHFIFREAIIKPVSFMYRLFSKNGRAKIRLINEMNKCTNYEEWRALSARMDALSDVKKWLEDSQQGVQVDLKALRKHTRALKIARQSEDARELAFLLRVCCHRNFCGLRSPMLYAYSFVSTKNCVEDFYTEVLRCLDYLDEFVYRSASQTQSNSASQSAEAVSSSGGSDDDVDNTDGGKSADGPKGLGEAASPRHVKPDRHKRSGNQKYLQFVAKRYDSMNSPNTTAKPAAMPPAPAPGDFGIAHYTQLISDLRLAMGRTALCLSGGGGLTVYHCGVVKTLIQENLMPRVISGTSGGSIMAAMLATRSDAEILALIESANFLSQPQMQLAPPFLQQFSNLFKIGTLMNEEVFSRSARMLVGEMTFADAFNKTGRFVSITTTRASAHAAGDPLVCNVINTPTVLVWSAMVASCALPLVLPPMRLLARGESVHLRATGGRTGTIRSSTSARFGYNASAGAATESGVSKTDDALSSTRPYAPGDMKFVDGSILQDIPVAELQTSFNVKSFLVSQVNPHFTPFIQDAAAYKEKENWFVGLVDKLWNYITLDLRNRYARLLVLAIVPHIKGQDVSPFLMQTAEGHCTIVPANPSDFCKITSCPNVPQVRQAVICGERKSWPYVKRLRHMTCIELKLRQLWQKQRRP